MIRWIEIAERRRKLVWLMIAFLAVVTVLLGYFGFRQHYMDRVARAARIAEELRTHPELAVLTDHVASDGEVPGDGTLVYLTAQLFVMESGAIVGEVPPQLEAARYLAPIVAASATLGAVAAFLGRGLSGWRLRSMKRHIVLCGLGRRGGAVVADLLDRGRRVVVIEQQTSGSLGAAIAERGGVVLTGDATDPELLGRAQVHRSAALFALCGHDDTNVEVALQAREIVAAQPSSKPRLVLHLDDMRLGDDLLGPEPRQADAPTAVCAWDFFNVDDEAAEAVLATHYVFDPKVVARRAQPRLTIVGGRRLGERIAIRASERWSERHRWLAEQGAPEPPLEVALVNPGADEQVRHLTAVGSGLAEGTEIVADPRDVATLTAEQRATLVRQATTVYVCEADDLTTVRSALRLWRESPGAQTRIIVCLDRWIDLAALHRDVGTQRDDAGRLQPFAILERSCNADLLPSDSVEQLARDAHERFRAARIGQGQTGASTPFLVPWDQLPETIRNSNRRQVLHGLRQKLELVGRTTRPVGALGRAIDAVYRRVKDWPVVGAQIAKLRGPRHTFTDAEVELLSQDEHDRWDDERLLAGWRLYDESWTEDRLLAAWRRYKALRGDEVPSGPQAGAGGAPATPPPAPNPRELRLSPYLIPWDALTDEVKKWDSDAVRALPSMLRDAGLDIVPSARRHDTLRARRVGVPGGAQGES